MMQDEGFERWWVDEVLPKLSSEDADLIQAAKKLCQIAWANGRYVQQLIDEALIREQMEHTSFTCHIDQASGQNNL